MFELFLFDGNYFAFTLPCPRSSLNSSVKLNQKEKVQTTAQRYIYFCLAPLNASFQKFI